MKIVIQTSFFITLFLSTLYCSAENVTMVICTHGIMSIKPHLNLDTFVNLIRDNVEDTVYSQTVEYMREDDFFERNQAMQKIGLQEIDPTCIKKGYSSGAFARLYDRMCCWDNNKPKENNLYYTYGWAGLLSPSRRYSDAISLYKSLYSEAARLRSQGKNPKIKLIGYSHGGNVCLNLALVKQQENVPQDLIIDELILLGMPVQTETDYLVCDPIFKKVYHFYSRGDRIQKLDFFSTKRFFSRRLFKEHKNLTLPDNLLQIQLKVVRSVRGKKNKCNKSRLLNLHKKAHLWGKTSNQRDASPGHIELWFFGWTPANYREDYIFNPLPAAVFIPVIIDAVEKVKERALKDNPQKPILVDIHPEQEYMVIKNQKSKNNMSVMDFPAVETIHDMQDIAQEYEPESYSVQEYNDHVSSSYNRARNEYVDKNAKHKHKKHRNRSKKRTTKALLISQADRVTTTC